MSEQHYQQFMSDLIEARLAASEIDLREGRVQRGSADDLMNRLTSDD